MEQVEKTKKAMEEVKHVDLGKVLSVAVDAYLKYDKIDRLEKFLIHKLMMCLAEESEKELRKCVKEVLDGYVKEVYEK